MAPSETALQIPISQQQIIEALKKMDKVEQEAFVEELISIISPEYLESIREARKDYHGGRTYSHKEVFG